MLSRDLLSGTAFYNSEKPEQTFIVLARLVNESVFPLVSLCFLL